MPPARDQETCPACGEPVAAADVKCRACGERLPDDDDDDRPRRKARQDNSVEATDFLVPTNVSVWAMASCYLGLIGFCVPVVGLIFAVPALIFGIIALTRPRKATTYGGATSNVRAIIGVVLSSLAILGWGVVLVLIALNAD